jgi:hypothetical protein
MASLAYKWTAAVALALSLALIAGIWHLGSNSMIACGFFGAFFIFVGIRPGSKLLLIAAAAGTGYAACYAVLGGPFDRAPLVALISAGAFLGVGTITVMACQTIWASPDHPDLRAALRDALVLPAFSLVAGLGMNWANGFPERTYDHLLYAFDGVLFSIPPGQTVTALFRTLPWIAGSSSVAYQGLLIFPPLYRGWALHRGLRNSGVNVLHAFVVAGLAGFVLYQVCPAEGPVYAFGARFPDHLPNWRDVSLAPYLSAGIHNAIPSMHMTWALLILWSALELGPLALAMAGALTGFTLLATLGSGEHYLVDLVVSVPLACAVWNAFRRDKPRVALGLGLVCAWLIYLRSEAFLLCPGIVNWMFITGTFAAVATAEYLKNRAIGLGSALGAREQLPGARQGHGFRFLARVGDNSNQRGSR